MCFKLDLVFSDGVPLFLTRVSLDRRRPCRANSDMSDSEPDRSMGPINCCKMTYVVADQIRNDQMMIIISAVHPVYCHSGRGRCFLWEQFRFKPAVVIIWFPQTCFILIFSIAPKFTDITQMTESTTYIKVI